MTDSVDRIYTTNTMGINVFVGYQQYITREDNRLDGYILYFQNSEYIPCSVQSPKTEYRWGQDMSYNASRDQIS